MEIILIGLMFMAVAAYVAWDYGGDIMARIKLNKDKTVDLNDFSKRVTLEESGAEQVSIGQVKEIIKKTAKELMAINNELGYIKMAETVRRLAK